MRRIIAALLLAPLLAVAGPNDIVVTQRNTTDTGLGPNRLVAPPANNADGIMGYVGATQRPIHWGIGPGLSLSGGVLSSMASAPTWDAVTGKPIFSPVATSGSYADLANRPALFSGAYGDLTGRPATFPPSAHSQAWSTITATPTSLAGYGITDGLSQAELTATLGSYATNTALTTGLSTKFNQPTGTTAQYIRGNGTLATLPVSRRIETYTGTTNAQGQITVVYPTAFPSVPVVQPPAPALASQVWTTVSSTTTGFTLQLNQRNAVTLLAVEVLLGATVPVNGAAATFLVVAQ